MITKRINKASILLGLIGDKLPDGVYQHLSARDLEKLALVLENNQLPNIKEQNKFLTWFNESLLSSNHSTDSGYSIEESQSHYDILADLFQKNSLELTQIIHGETPHIIALVLFFANPIEVSSIIAELPEKLLGNVLLEIQKIDYHAEKERDELERFLKFKNYLLKNKIPPAKISDRKSKKMAEILSGLNPHTSQNLFAKIKEKSPLFAENIEEHYYSFADIMKMSRSDLSEFLSGFHPIVTACALKGMEKTAVEKILHSIEPWLSRLVQLESDSMGPVSLAEIEEAQKGILTGLTEAIEAGKIRLWKGVLYGKAGI